MVGAQAISENPSRRLKIALALWIAVTSLALTFVTVEWVTTKKRLSAILSHSAETTAHWNWKECGHKPAQEFTFIANGMMYHGYDPGPHLDCQHIKLGDPIEVFYDTSDPSSQFVGDKRNIPAMIDAESFGYLFVAVWSFAIFAVAVLPKWRAARKSSS